MSQDTFTSFTITKRTVTRTFLVARHPWREIDADTYPAKHFRFYSDRSEYTRGQMRLVFDLTGRAIEGWSYYTCMFTVAEPTEDHPNGRIIENDDSHGSTTSQHTWAMRPFFEGGDDAYVTVAKYTRATETRLRKGFHNDTPRPTQVYTKRYFKTFESERVNLAWHHRAIQIGWGRGVGPSDMRSKLTADMRSPAQVAADDLAAAVARAEREARWAKEQAEFEAREAVYYAEREAARNAAAVARDASMPMLKLVQGGAK